MEGDRIGHPGLNLGEYATLQEMRNQKLSSLPSDQIRKSQYFTCCIVVDLSCPLVLISIRRTNLSHHMKKDQLQHSDVSASQWNHQRCSTGNSPALDSSTILIAHPRSYDCSRYVLKIIKENRRMISVEHLHQTYMLCINMLFQQKMAGYNPWCGHSISLH